MNDERISITMGDAGWSVSDWVKVALAASGALAVIVLLALIPTMLA